MWTDMMRPTRLRTTIFGHRAGARISLVRPITPPRQQRRRPVRRHRPGRGYGRTRTRTGYRTAVQTVCVRDVTRRSLSVYRLKPVVPQAFSTRFPCHVTAPGRFAANRRTSAREAVAAGPAEGRARASTARTAGVRKSALCTKLTPSTISSVRIDRSTAGTDRPGTGARTTAHTPRGRAFPHRWRIS